MLHSMILEGPAFLISVHLGILFSVSYVVAFLANVLDSPSATKSLLGEDTQIQIETRHVCALASVWRARSTLSDLVPHIQVPPNTGAATHRFLLFNLTGLAPSLESLFNAPSPPTPESRAAALALVNHLERLQAQGEEANRRYSHQTHDAPVVVDYSDSPEHDGNGDSDSGEDSVDEHEGATQESVFFEFDDAEDAVSHFSNSGRHHVVVTPNQPNLEDLRTATNFYQINYQTAAAQVQPGLSNQGYRLHDYPQQQRYDCFLRDSTSSRYGGTSSRPAVDLCAAVCGVYLDLSTTGPGKTKNVNYPNPFQRPWFSLCHHVFHLVLAVWLLFLFARVEMARITRDQTSLDSYRYPVRKNLALFWGYVLLISFLRTLVLDQKYEQGAAGGRSSLNSEGAEVADIIPWDRWSWSTTSTSREGSSSGQESFKVLKEAAGVVSSSWAAASLNGSTAAKGFYSWLSTAAPGLLPWATAHRDDHSQTAGAGYLQDASEDEPALLTQQQASRSPEDDYKEAPTATSTSSSIPEDVAPPPPAGRVSSVLGGGWFRLFFAVVCVEVEQTGLLFLVITIAFITLVTVGFVLARVFQAVRGALVFLVRLVCFLCFKTELDAVTLVSQTADNKIMGDEWVARSLREGMALEYGLRDCDVLGKTGASSSEEDGDEDLDRLGDVMDDFQEVVPGASGTTVSLQKELLRGVKRQCRRLLSKSKKAVLRVVLGNGFGEGRGEDDGSCSGGGRSGPGMLLHKAKSSGILRQLLQREAARSGPTLQPDDPDHALPSRRWASHEDEDVRVNGEDVYAHLPHQHQTNYPSSTTPTHSQQLCHSPLSFLSKLRPRVLASFESHFFRRQNALLQLQSCGHKFHASCLEAHFHTQIGRRAKHRSSCPLCRSVNERQHASRVLVEFLRSLLEFLAAEIDFLYFGLLLYVFLIAFSTTILLEFFLYFVSCLTDLLRQFHVVLEHAYTPAHALVVDEEDDAVSAGGGAEGGGPQALIVEDLEDAVPLSSWGDEVGLQFAEAGVIPFSVPRFKADADAEEDHVHHSNATAISSVQVAANGEIVTSRVDQSLGEPQHSAGAREGDRGAEVGEHLLRDFRAAVGLSLGEAASLPVADLLRLQQRVNFLHSSTVGHQEHYSDVGGESAYNVDHRSTSDQPQPQVGVGVGPPKNLNTSKSSSRLRTRDGGVKLWDLLVANFSKSQLFCLFLTPATFFLVLLLLYEYRSCIEFLLQKLAVLYLKFFGDRVEIRVSVSSPGPAVGFPNDPDQEHVAPGGVDVGGPSSDGSSPAGGGTTGTLQMPGAAGPAAAEFIPSAAISSSAGAGGAASTSSPDEFEFDSAPDDRMFDSEEEDSTFEGGGGGTGRGRYVTYVCCVTPVLHACCEGARVLYVYAFAPVTVFWKGVFLEACGETLELCAEEVLPWYFSRRRVKMLQNAWKKSRTRGVWSHLSEEAAGEVEAPARRDEDVEVVAGEGVAEVGRMTLLRAARMLREQEKEVLREQLLVQNEMDESEAGTSTCSSCASSLSTSAAPAKPGRINDVREDHVESVRRRQLASTFGKDWNFSNSYAASPEVLAQGESRRAAVRLRPHEDRDRVREEGENEDHTAKSLEDDRVQFLPYNYILPPLLHSPLRFLTAVITSCAFLVHYILCFQAVFCFKVLHIFWIKIVVVRFLLAVPMWLFSSNIGVMGALPRSWRRRSRGSAFEPAEVEYDESASEDETEAGDDVFVGGDEDVGTAVVASYLWTLLRKGAREPFRVHNLLPGRGGHGVRGTRSIVDAEKRNREGIIGNEEGRVDAETSDAGGVTAEGATRRSYLLQIAASFYGAVRQRLHFFVPRRFYSGSNNITSFTEILAQNNERVLLFPVGPPRSSPSPILNESAAPAASSSLQEVVLVRASAVALSLKRRCVLSLLLSYPLAYCMVRWYFVTHVIYLALLFFPLLFARGRGGAGGMDDVRSGESILKAGEPFFAAQLGVAAFLGTYQRPFLMQAKAGYRYEPRTSTSDEGGLLARGSGEKRWHLDLSHHRGTSRTPRRVEDEQVGGIHFPTAPWESPLSASVLAAVAEAEAGLLLFEQAAAAAAAGSAISYFTDSLDLVRSLELGFCELRSTGQTRSQSKIANAPWYPAYTVLRQSGLLAALVESIRDFVASISAVPKNEETAFRRIDEFKIVHVRSASVLRRGFALAATGTSSFSKEFSAAEEEVEHSELLRTLQFRGPFMLGNQLADDLASSVVLVRQETKQPLDLLAAGDKFSQTAPLVKRKRAFLRAEGENYLVDDHHDEGHSSGRSTEVFRAWSPGAAFYLDRRAIWKDLRLQTDNNLQAALKHLPGLLQAGARGSLQLRRFLVAGMKQYRNWEEGAGRKKHAASTHREDSRISSDSTMDTNTTALWRAFSAGEQEEEEGGGGADAEEVDVQGDEEVVAGVDAEAEELAPETALERFRRWARGRLSQVPVLGGAVPPLFYRLDAEKPPLSADVETGFGAGGAMAVSEFVERFGAYEAGLRAAFLEEVDQNKTAQPSQNSKTFLVKDAAMNLQQLASYYSRLRVLKSHVRPWIVHTEQSLVGLAKLMRNEYKDITQQYAKEASFKSLLLPPVPRDLHHAPRLVEALKTYLRERVQLSAPSVGSSSPPQTQLSVKQRDKYIAGLVKDRKKTHEACVAMGKGLAKDLGDVAQNLALGAPAGLAEKGYADVADKFAGVLRSSALPAVDDALEQLEEKFLALLEETFGGAAREQDAEDEERETPQEPAGEQHGEARAEVAKATGFVASGADEQDAAARDELDGLCAGFARCSLSASSRPEAASRGLLAAPVFDLDAVTHLLQFSVVMNDLGHVFSLVRKEYDHLSAHKAQLLLFTETLSERERKELEERARSSKSLPTEKKTIATHLLPPLVRKDAASYFQDALAFMRVSVYYRAVEDARSSTVRSEKNKKHPQNEFLSWHAFGERKLRQQTHTVNMSSSGAAFPRAGDAAAFLERRGGGGGGGAGGVGGSVPPANNTEAAAGGTLPLTPWVVVQLLLAPVGATTGRGASNSSAEASPLPDLTTAIWPGDEDGFSGSSSGGNSRSMISPGRAGAESPSRPRPSRAGGVKAKNKARVHDEDNDEDDFSVVAALLRDRRMQKKSLSKYGNALYQLPYHTVEAKMERSSSLEAKKDELVARFFAHFPLISGGRESNNRLERSLRVFLCKIFVERVELVARPDAEALAGRQTLHLDLADTMWLDLDLGQLDLELDDQTMKSMSKAGELLLAARAALLFEEFWDEVDALGTIAQTQQVQAEREEVARKQGRALYRTLVLDAVRELDGGTRYKEACWFVGSIQLLGGRSIQLPFKELWDHVVSGQLQFAPPQNQAESWLDQGTGLAVNEWAMGSLVPRDLGMLARAYGDAGDGFGRPVPPEVREASAANWLVVEGLSTAAFRRAYKEELHAISSTGVGLGANKFLSEGHKSCSAAWLAALAGKGMWKVAKADELLHHPAVLYGY
eukprot:g7062.t1